MLLDKDHWNFQYEGNSVKNKLKVHVIKSWSATIFPHTCLLFRPSKIKLVVQSRHFLRLKRGSHKMHTINCWFQLFVSIDQEDLKSLFKQLFLEWGKGNMLSIRKNWWWHLPPCRGNVYIHFKARADVLHVKSSHWDQLTPPPNDNSTRVWACSLLRIILIQPGDRQYRWRWSIFNRENKNKSFQVSSVQRDLHTLKGLYSPFCACTTSLFWWLPTEIII